MNRFENEHFDEERALYGMKKIELNHCRFEGEKDGESALKECRDVKIADTFFGLRYPLWHVKRAILHHCEMDENCRAALWYDSDVLIENSCMKGIKAIRECKNVQIKDTSIHSIEFGWFSKQITLTNCELTGEYPFLKSNELTLNHIKLNGKYSFQYVKNMVIRHSDLRTKDAFWHSKNVEVYDSVIQGEYLGWYSENLRLVRCKIIGTQPLCYCENLILEDCEMMDCDLSFERSEVQATIQGEIMSVKNPLKGSIIADRINEIIMDESAIHSTCKIERRDQLKVNQ